MSTGKTDSLNSVIGSPNLWSLTTICLIMMFSMVTINASAQILPPPVPNLKIENGEPQAKETQSFSPKVFNPPQIHIITNVLRDGKNVLKMNITSEAPIEGCKITFTKDDTKKTVDCIRDIGTVFKSLIDAKQPSQTVYIQARDVYGDSSSTVEKLSVLPALTIDEAIWNSLRSIIGETKYIIHNIMALMNNIHFFVL